MKDNIFVVGPQATGESFFGRSEYIDYLDSCVFRGVGAIHLVGAPRIGKSSLVSYLIEKNKGIPDRICVKINMSDCEDDFDFWIETLAEEIKDKLQEMNLWNDYFESIYNKIENVELSDSRWYAKSKSLLNNIFSQIKKIDRRLVLIIDEFDAVERIFDQKPYCFSLLRSIFSEPKYVTSGIIISRRRLHLFEAKCPYISTFHGVFHEKTLLGFDEKDMAVLYSKIESYGITVSSDQKHQIEQCTGRMPYLCCMLAHCMVDHCEKSKDLNIVKLFREFLPEIDRYYNDLILRLDEDQYKETVYILTVSSKFPYYITSRDIENMRTMGLIVPKISQEGLVEYLVYSEDFMTYLKLTPLKLPLWDTMTMSERKLNELVKKEYPELDTVTHDDLLKDATIVTKLNTKYPELRLSAETIKSYCYNLQRFKDYPTILDVLTLSKITGIIIGQWSSRFFKYFPDNDWKDKLKHISNIRNPVAHDKIEYISKEDLTMCLKYCEDIIKLL